MNNELRLLRRALLLASACALAWPGRAQTTIAPTPNFGAMVATTSISGSPGSQTVTIPASLGQQRGANLFHSFTQFDVGTGDTAKFTDTGLTTPMTIANIIARIYSASPSSIDGHILVDTTGHLATANLFLINPNGVIFGPNATVSVPGDFVASTANYVKLTDGTGIFYSDPTKGADVLTASPVDTFGFLKSTSPTASITVAGGATLTAGGSLQFVTSNFSAGAGANLSVTKAATPIGIFAGSQTAANADGTAPYLTGAVTDYSSEANFTKHGSVTLGGATGGASLSSSGNGGSVVIRGGQIVQLGTGASITARSRVAINAKSLALSGAIATTAPTGTIGIDTTGDITLTNGSITSQGGSIALGQASLVNLTLDHQSSIATASGSGGLLSINSTGTINNGGTISTVGSGNALQVNALALNLTSSGNTAGSIKTSGAALTLGTLASPLGGLTLDSNTLISITGGSGGTLAIATSGVLANNGGSITTVGANEAVQIGAQSLVLTGLISTQAGDLSINTTAAMTLTGGTISAQGGALTLGQNALTDLSLDSTSLINGVGSPVSITARGDITLSGGSIESISATGLNADNVTVADPSGNITLDSGAQIASIASGNRSAGNVNVNSNGQVNSAKTLTITGTGVAAPNTGIFSLSNGTGNAGSVNVTALGNVVLSGGGQIAAVATNTSGGNTGSVNLALNANPSTLTIGGVSANANSPVPIIYTSTANPNKSAGDVNVDSILADVHLQSGAAIQTSAQDATAGNIVVEATSLTMDPYSAIQSLMTQVSKNDNSTSGATGNVLVIVLNPRSYPFAGPLSIADNAFIQTVANPNKKSFNPLGQVTVFAGTLTEGGMTVPLSTDGFDYNYIIAGHTEIRMQNSTSVNSPNGNNVSNAKPFVENLFGYPNTSGGTTLPTPPAGNGIVLDGTLGGTAGLITPTLSGLTYTYTITPGDGTQVGNNLFLSFSEFTLGINHPDPNDLSKVGPVSEEALFDAPGIANIVARITGGSPSEINGLLQETSGTTANLFFLNPSGMMFTNNSSLRLNGALTLSTANSAQLGGAGTFLAAPNTLADMLLTTAPSLFTGPVSGFGFTTATPAAISFDTATLSNDASANSQIQVIAGDITLKNGSILNASQTLLFSAGSAGTLTFSAPGGSLTTISPGITAASQILDDSTFSALGTVALTSGSVLTVPSPNIASTIIIRAGTFNLTDSIVVDQTTADTGSLGGKVLIDVTGAAAITSATNSSTISTSSLGASDAGSVQINAASLTITGDSNHLFTTGILSTAQPANYFTSDSGFVPFTYADPTTATGNAGSIILHIGGPIAVATFGEISTNTNGLGNAGTISIQGANGINPQLTVSGGSSITSSTSLDNPAFTRTGNAGTVVATLSSLAITGFPSLIATSAGTPTNTAGPTGDGGNINLTVTGHTGAGNGDISISDGAFISASSFNNGKGGTVVLNQTNSQHGIVINGQGSTPSSGPGTGIFAAEYADGSSSGLGPTMATSTPAINIMTDSTILLKAGGEISTSAAGNGSAGPVRVVSGNLSIDGTGADASQSTGILSSSTGTVLSGTNPNATGNGGDITLTVAGDVTVANGGAISASSQTVGEAGTVTITQSGSADLADPATNPTIIGGLYLNGGSITTAASGIGTATPVHPDAGNITLNTQALTLNNSGAIISSTFGLSKAGDITVNGVTSNAAAQWVLVKGGSVIASNTGGAGNGGAISILTGALTVDNSAISTNAIFGTGGGGSIGLTVTGAPNTAGATGDVAITNGGTISALSQTTGEAGTVTITQSGSRDITDPTLNPATNGGLYLNNGLITTAANGPGTATPANAHAGDITLKTEAVTMTGGSRVLSSTAGHSKAGDVTVAGPTNGSNTQFVVLQGGAQIASETGGANGSGAGGTITVGAGSLLADNAVISTSTTGGIGNAGNIALAVDSFATLQNGATIVSASDNSGSAGMISITANSVTVYGAGSAISTDAGTIGSTANTRGEIVLAGRDISIANSGLISATTGGLSPGGTITVNAGNSVGLTSYASLDASSTAATGGGNGGSILIGSDPSAALNDYGVNSPHTLSLSNHSTISCDSQNTNGGNIAIHAGQVVLENNSLISTSEPNGPANTLGGNITIKALQLFYLNNFSFIDSNAGQGRGGDIRIDPQFVILNHSGINAVGGAGNGNVFIDASYVLSGTSFILATGTVNIDSLPLDLTGSLLPLPADLTSEEKRLREKCARAVNHEFSSFIVVGRGGTESAPEEFQPDFGLDNAPFGYNPNFKVPH